MGVTAVGTNNSGLNARDATFAKSTVVNLVGRFHLHVCYQERFIPPKIDFHMKLMLSLNNILCKLAAPGQGAQQNIYKLVIESINLIIRTKKLTSTAHNALMNLLVTLNMVRNYSLVEMKNLSIPANQTSINCYDVFTSALLDLVIVGLVIDADLAGATRETRLISKIFASTASG